MRVYKARNIFTKIRNMCAFIPFIACFLSDFYAACISIQFQFSYSLIGFHMNLPFAVPPTKTLITKYSSSPTHSILLWIHKLALKLSFQWTEKPALKLFLGLNFKISWIRKCLLELTSIPCFWKYTPTKYRIFFIFRCSFNLTHKHLFLCHINILFSASVMVAAGSGVGS